MTTMEASRADLLASRTDMLASRADLLASMTGLLASGAMLSASRAVLLASSAAPPGPRPTPAIPSPMDLSRYQRQMILPGFGEKGQRRLAAAHAVIVGVGALGCVTGDLLARAGVGTITLIDRDIVEKTNLQRQTLFTEADADAATPKAEAARARLAAVNSSIAIHARVADLTAASAMRLLDDAASPPTVLLDGTDNFETRYLLNDLAISRGLPLVYAGVVGTAAMAMTILPEAADIACAPGPCLRCVFPEPPPPGSAPTCDTAGVLGPVATTIAAYQATEAIKILLGRFDLVLRSLLSFDPWHGRRTRLDLADARRAECPCCGRRSFDFLDAAPSAPAVSLCGRGAVQVSPPAPTTLDLAALADRLAPLGSFRKTDFLVIGELASERGDGGEPVGLAVFADGRAQIRGVASPERARALYARFVGA